MIVVDIETTGMYPEKNSILSIGAVDFSNPKNRFYGECRMDEGASVSNIAMKINGFSMEEIKDPEKPTSKELLTDFLKWSRGVRGKVLAGDNIWFDVSFLKVNLKRIGRKWPFAKKVLELHESSPLLEGLPWSLDAVLHMVGIPPRDSAHNALDDAELTAEAIARVTEGKNLIKRFRKYPVPGVFEDYLNARKAGK